MFTPQITNETCCFAKFSLPVIILIVKLRSGPSVPVKSTSERLVKVDVKVKEFMYSIDNVLMF